MKPEHRLQVLPAIDCSLVGRPVPSSPARVLWRNRRHLVGSEFSSYHTAFRSNKLDIWLLMPKNAPFADWTPILQAAEKGRDEAVDYRLWIPGLSRGRSLAGQGGPGLCTDTIH